MKGWRQWGQMREGMGVNNGLTNCLKVWKVKQHGLLLGEMVELIITQNQEISLS